MAGTYRVIVAIMVMKACSPSRNRRALVRKSILDRPRNGAYHELLQELSLTNGENYRHCLRIDMLVFQAPTV